MRTEWRNVLIAMILLPVGTGPAFARQNPVSETRGASGELVRLTLELNWGTQRSGADLPDGAPVGVGPAADSEFVLEMSEGKVVDALNWPPSETRSGAG